MGYFYLGLAFLGAVAPYSFLGQFLLTHGLSFTEFKTQMAANSVSSFLGASFFIAGLVTFFFILGEGRRLKMRGLWLPLLATLAVGVSCGLPLFFYLRNQAVIRNEQ
ncbi:MAG: DUF2834 domain-containing protein [Candidatus Adiutrix sp.]|jgi:hypothetical protein|nr:DUF2834 domain-containing protein [Candidatus Adiutrix sp.]